MTGRPQTCLRLAGPCLRLDRDCDCAACRQTASASGYTPHYPPTAGEVRRLPPQGDQ